jgi:hypothetical protein
VTRHHSCRVSPFGHPRIHARLTTPRGISQPPTSFIGSQCQGIHHAPLNTYNTKPKNESPTHAANHTCRHQKNCTSTHTEKPPPKHGSSHSMRARCSQPLSTNQTPHPTTKVRRQQPTPPQESDPTLRVTTPPVSHTRDKEVTGLLSQSPIVCLAIIFDRRPQRDSRTDQLFVVHPTRATTAASSFTA